MENSGVAVSSAEATAQLPGDKAAAASTTPSTVPSQGRVLRGRGASRSKTGVPSSGPNDQRLSAPGPGRVLRDRSTRGVTAGKNTEGGSNANRRRKPAYPRRRRNAVTRAGNTEDIGDDNDPAKYPKTTKDSADIKALHASRPQRPRRPQTLSQQRTPSKRVARPPPALACKSEPDTESMCVEDEGVLGRTGDSDEEDDDLRDEEEPPFGDDQTDQNYKLQTESEGETSSEDDLPFRDDLNDRSYEPQIKRAPPRPRRRPLRPKKKSKERARDQERDVKTEGAEETDVKLENEFGDRTEPPRKSRRGRRRKDDKSPRLPKRRKKPPVQYVRCEMEGCGTVLAHPRYLQHHIKYQHLLKKKYVCPHPSCGRLFRLQKQLLRHAKHHTDQRDYICEYCARAFKSSHNLAVHRMIHTGEKPLQCEICGFTCRQKASLNWHMKKHDADAFYQFSCNICGKKFEKKDSVVAHKAKSHPEVMIAEALAANAGALVTEPALTEQSLHALTMPQLQQVPPQQELHLQQLHLLQLQPHSASASASALPTQTQDLVDSGEILALGSISALSSSSPPPPPPPPSSASLEPQAVPAEEEQGVVWEELGGKSEEEGLERMSDHSQQESHHGLM